MFSVYILFSESRNRFYVGQTNDLTDRIRRHNEGRNKATKSGGPWVLVYAEEFGTRSEAVRRESEIKTRKSRLYIESLTKGQNIPLLERDGQ